MPFNIIFDASKQGLRAVLKGWEEQALRVFWENPGGEFSSKEVCIRVNERLGGGSISRASIINFLEEMTSAGILRKREITGKGGYRGIYSQAMNESGFRAFIAETMIECLMRGFLEETKEVVRYLSQR
jgi:Fe2+ or Zn2+ uptake regulation protein